jgi:hypothetical protein
MQTALQESASFLHSRLSMTQKTRDGALQLITNFGRVADLNLANKESNYHYNVQDFMVGGEVKRDDYL